MKVSDAAIMKAKEYWSGFENHPSFALLETDMVRFVVKELIQAAYVSGFMTGVKIERINVANAEEK
jgi:hypothetical protein